MCDVNVLILRTTTLYESPGTILNWTRSLMWKHILIRKHHFYLNKYFIKSIAILYVCKVSKKFTLQIPLIFIPMIKIMLSLRNSILRMFENSFIVSQSSIYQYTDLELEESSHIPAILQIPTRLFSLQIHLIIVDTIYAIKNLAFQLMNKHNTKKIIEY